MNNTYPINIIPEGDSIRVAALERYRILNTPNENAFTHICKLAAAIFKVPIAHISFLNADTEFIKAAVGLPEGLVMVDRGESLCALAVLNAEVTVVENALEEPLLANHPYVHGDFGLRFYAGAPIITPDAQIIGTMCLVDKQPRTLSHHEISVLRNLAEVAMEQVELRLANIEKTLQQKKINEQLTYSQERLQSILDTMAEGVAIVEQGGNLIYINQLAQRIFGINDINISKLNFYNDKWENLRLDGSVLPEDEHPLALVLKTGSAVYDQEIGIRIPGQELFYISVNAAPIYDNEQNLTGGIATFIDVTKRLQLMKQKDEFISVASHELKTPITSLKAALQILDKLKEKPGSPALPVMIGQANKSLEKLSTLVTDLLNVNRINQGQLQLRKNKFVVADMINDCSQHIRTTGNYHIQLKGDMQLKINADEQRIDQVIVNMINNAIKYAPASKNIEIIVERQDDMARISVKDNGPGIAPEKLPHLFDRYYRGDYSGIQFSGLGLGLYISSDIVKKHGGEIGVNTEQGKGSTFWFTLPIN